MHSWLQQWTPSPHPLQLPGSAASHPPSGPMRLPHCQGCSGPQHLHCRSAAVLGPLHAVGHHMLLPTAGFEVSGCLDCSRLLHCRGLARSHVTRLCQRPASMAARGRNERGWGQGRLTHREGFIAADSSCIEWTAYEASAALSLPRTPTVVVGDIPQSWKQKETRRAQKPSGRQQSMKACLRLVRLLVRQVLLPQWLLPTAAAVSLCLDGHRVPVAGWFVAVAAVASKARCCLSCFDNRLEYI